MPKQLHKKLAKSADKLVRAGEMKKKKKDAYVYGTMSKMNKMKDLYKI